MMHRAHTAKVRKAKNNRLREVEVPIVMAEREHVHRGHHSARRRLVLALVWAGEKPLAFTAQAQTNIALIYCKCYTRICCTELHWTITLHYSTVNEYINTTVKK